MQVIWSDEAIQDYHSNIEYLLARWSAKSASNFIDEVESVLEIIKQRPEIFPLVGHGSVRKAVVRKQISLFYYQDVGSVYLIRFWNNYQNPGNLKL